MTGNNEASRVYQDAMTAQLGERVTNLGRRQTDLENEMRSGFKQIESSFSSFANETRQSNAQLASSLAERNKPQWQAIGVTITFCTVLGGLVYWPINTATSDLKSAVSVIVDKMVTREEIEWRAARSAEDRQRADNATKDLRESMVPRQELNRIFENQEQWRTEFAARLDRLENRPRATE